MGLKLTIEIPLFLSVLGFMLTSTIGNNLLIYRTCYIILGYNKSDCAKLGFVDDNDTRQLEKLVEPTSDYISLVKNIVDTTLGSVMCLFVAPWSDRFGRKPILVLGFVGGVFASLFHVVFAAWDELSPWYLMAVSIPVLLTGGGPSFMTILFSYLTDSTTKEERGLRMGIFDIVMQVAVLIGNSSSSYLLIATNYVIVYSISAACPIIALIYTIFFLPESLQQRESENKVGEFFNIANFIEMVKTPFKRREKSKRTILLLIMLVFLFTYVTDGARNLGFYFLRQKLHWTLTQITWFGSAMIVLGIVGTFVVVYLLHTLLRLKESILIFVGFCFSVASLILTGFAKKDWQIYLASIINMPSSGQGALTRSLISKLVHTDEIAKIFSACSIGSTILSPLSSTGYTVLYNATINTNPGFFNFVTAGIIACATFIFMVIVIVQYKADADDYTVLENEQNGDINHEAEHIYANTVTGEEA